MDTQLELNLASQIRETYTESIRLAQEAKNYVSDAVVKAVECGRLLIQQKEGLQHGGWLDWVHDNLSDISYETLARYMRVAKSINELQGKEANGDLSHVTNLENPSSLRQAYIALGILPQPKPKDETPDPQKPWVKYVKFLDGFRLWFNKRVDQSPLDDWPDDARRVLKNELKWFAELYETL